MFGFSTLARRHRTRVVLRKCSHKASSVTLHGEASSPGFYKGRACLITDPEKQEEKLQYGDVLVCKMTSDKWNSLISEAGAMVVEQGGKVSHGPMVARRIGIPCVSDLPDSVWDYIEDGDELIVRGNVGSVEVCGKTEIPGKALRLAPPEEAADIKVSPEEMAALRQDPSQLAKILATNHK